VTGKQIIILAVSIIVVLATSVGFFITLDVSPQIAYARLFIDAGLLIGSIAVVMAFYKDKELPTEGLIHALNSLKNANYKTRIDLANFGDLGGIAASINELAEYLDKEHEKQQEIKRSLREELLPGLKQKEATSFEHSYHPELGPVLRTIPIDNETQSNILTKSPANLKKNHEAFLSNPLINRNPPEINNKSVFPPTKLEQNLAELYERFLSAQPVSSQVLDYNIFLSTIEKSKEDLMKTYQCHNIWFDIVKEEDEVALQPHIVR
jgi:hypothetical protein